MSLIRSVTFGEKGDYSLLGIEIHFIENLKFSSEASKNETKKVRPTLKARMIIAMGGPQNFNLLFQPYLHTLSHEMGHAAMLEMALKMNETVSIRNLTPSIRIYQADPADGIHGTHQTGGVCIWNGVFRCIPHWQQAAIAAAGPIANIAFSSCKVLGGAALAQVGSSFSTLPSLCFSSAATVLIMGGGVQIYDEVSHALWPSRGHDFTRVERLSGTGGSLLAKGVVITELAFTAMSLLKLQGYF